MLAAPGLLHGVAASLNGHDYELCFVIILGPVEAICILREMVACIVFVQLFSLLSSSSFPSMRRNHSV